MIKIKFDYDSSYVTNIRITGHANFDEYGKDIVCAAASSIAITSLNACLRINSKSIIIKQSEGLIDAKVLVKDDIINKILLNMKDMYTDLKEQYSENIKII